MRSFVALVVVWVGVVASPASSEEKLPAGPQASFLGNWAGESVRGIKRLEITRRDNLWQVEVWWHYGGDEKSAGKVKFHLLGDSLSAQDKPYGFATIADTEYGKGQAHLSFKVEDGNLVVEEFQIHTQPKDWSSMRRLYKFKRQ
jgi:hypothetical protein